MEARQSAAQENRFSLPTPTTVSGTGASALLRVNGGAEYCVPFGGAAGGQIANKGATSFKVTNPTAQACSSGD